MVNLKNESSGWGPEATLKRRTDLALITFADGNDIYEQLISSSR